jgi:Rrf2 family protein
MPGILKISEAASLALHTLIHLVKNKNRMVSVKEIAAALDRSEFHLSKVMQRLVRAGYMESVRGPRGGFKLVDPWEEITFLQIFEAIEGPLDLSPCIAGTPMCNVKQCIFGDLVKKMNHEFKEYMSNARLKDLAGDQVRSSA